MNEGRNVFVGILAIILGIIIIIFPLVGIVTLSVLTGVGIIFIGLWLLLQSFKKWKNSFAAGIMDLFLAIFAFLVGIVFLGNVAAFEFLSFLGLYLVGFFLILAGLEALFSGKDMKARGIGILGFALGIIYLVLGSYVIHPLFLSAIMGAFLIIAGIMEIFIKSKEVPKEE
ncbi:MAG TPA: DUF308 domain-containing protein [Methanobacteriaceae archaeon]|nr:DUF308 domain-containing protein [Methanobacteriaceae archaeon]